MPNIVEWDSSFSVGHGALDKQHQQLLAICNEMAKHVGGSQPVSRARFHEILNELTVYSRQHFHVEETLLLEMGYAGLFDQETEHLAYSEKIAEWAFDATVGTLDMQKAHAFLADWWKNHILVSDMRYRPLMESQH